MDIEEVTKEEYLKVIKHHNIFDAVTFNELNKYKVEKLKYLLFKGKKYKFGLCVGVKECEVLCPFSSPFATMVEINRPVSIKNYDQAIDSLDIFLTKNHYKTIRFILPPMFYDETGLGIFVNTLYRKGYDFKNIDLNFQFDLKKVCTEAYPEMIPRNGKKNLRIGLNSGLILKHCDNNEDAKKAYSVIAENREAKGFPLRMTFQQVMNTVRLVNHDFFMVIKDDEEIAAALIYYINENVAQVIYWGDRQGFGKVKPINYLACQLVHYYSERGLKYLDIGPSTENSVPNYGLCDFKKSIGCDVSTKITMIKRFIKTV